ncbi:hypothetical protein [Methyloligella solikamskensis]|uniref:BON domain-containing protein n=1 Tax=Methyloligella solikamskensis TaxID=1177756 RepID=A0ABW3JAS5_9HYPH
MSVRPTLLSLAIVSLLPVLFVAGALINQCRAEPDGARAETGISAQGAEQAAEQKAGAKQSEKSETSEASEAGGADMSAKSATSKSGTSKSSDSDDGKAASKAAAQDAAQDETPAEEAAEEASKVEPYRWMARRSDNKIKIRGAVPSEKDQRTVVGMAKAHFADLEIDDGMKVTEGAPPKEQWLGAVSFALKQLTHMKSGNVRLSDVALTVDGRAKSAGDFTELQEAVHGPLPTGLSVQKIAVAPPVADPFLFTASLEGNILRLAGNVPNEEMHAHLKDLAGNAFRGRAIDDQLVIASGAPENWEAAARAALAALSRLQDGKVTLSKDALKIDGTAPDKTTATEMSYQLRKDLPRPYRSSENIRWKEAGHAGDVANTIIPRIKEIVDSRNTALPNTLPSLER